MRSSDSEPFLADELPRSRPSRWLVRGFGAWMKWPSMPQLAVVLAALLLICIATVITGAVPTRSYGHDVFIFLDNGWRLLNGQRPHVDYVRQWGPVTFLVTAAGLWIANYSVNGVGYGNTVFGILIGAWSYWLGRNRLAASPRVVASVFLVLLIVAPYPLGHPFTESSHAMTYNRYGYTSSRD